MKRLFLSLFLLFSVFAYAGEKVLYDFQGGTDGYRPFGPLVFDSAGNLYGTTYYGGNEECDLGCGTVFELSPDAHGGWTETVLYRFTGGADGQQTGSDSFLTAKVTSMERPSDLAQTIACQSVAAPLSCRRERTVGRLLSFTLLRAGKTEALWQGG